MAHSRRLGVEVVLAAESRSELIDDVDRRLRGLVGVPEREESVTLEVDRLESDAGQCQPAAAACAASNTSGSAPEP